MGTLGVSSDKKLDFFPKLFFSKFKILFSKLEIFFFHRALHLLYNDKEFGLGTF